jgi:8-oxo-dGDP phosphatase
MPGEWQVCERSVCGCAVARVGGVVECPGKRGSLLWEQHGERTVYDSPWVQVTRVDVTPPDGNRFEHHAVRLKKVASIVVLDDEDHVLLVWRHRFITNSWGWETPGGIVDEGETGEQAAVRETVEETGWRPEGLRPLAAFQPMPGLVDTPHEIYLSRHAVKVGEHSDAVEAGVVAWVPLADRPDLIKRGEIAGSAAHTRRSPPAPTTPWHPPPRRRRAIRT